MNVFDRFRTPADVYEELFVPALFQQWGSIVGDAAQIMLGYKVLDVACGTGVLACAAADRVGPRGAVAGLDANTDMLSVARRKNSRVEWREGKAKHFLTQTKALMLLSASSASCSSMIARPPSAK